MSDIVTEKDYSIRNRWIMKLSISNLFISFFTASGVALLFKVASQGIEMPLFFYIIIFIPVFLVVFISRIVVIVLQKEFFHYEIGDKFLTIKQGIISKQQRQLPYSVIQNLFIRQSLLDRIFNLSLLNIENAQKGALTAVNRPTLDVIGSIGNTIYIPGLDPNDAETLKNLVLQKMKENPAESTSGL